MGYLSANQFAKIFGVSRQTVVNHIRRSKNRIKATKQARNLYLIAESEVRKWKAVQCGEYIRLKKL